MNDEFQMRKIQAIFISAYVSVVVFTLLYIPEYFVEDPFAFLEFIGWAIFFVIGYLVYRFIQRKWDKRKK